MVKASEVLPGPDPDGWIGGIKCWLEPKGVRDFAPVSLYCDQLTKVNDWLSKQFIVLIPDNFKETVAETFTKSKSPSSLKKRLFKVVPRWAVLKPSHVTYRLQNQYFALGDRVTMVQDSVLLSVKGVVVGLNAKSMDVV